MIYKTDVYLRDFILYTLINYQCSTALSFEELPSGSCLLQFRGLWPIFRGEAAAFIQKAHHVNNFLRNLKGHTVSIYSTGNPTSNSFRICDMSRIVADRDTSPWEVLQSCAAISRIDM